MNNKICKICNAEKHTMNITDYIKDVLSVKVNIH